MPRPVETFQDEVTAKGHTSITTFSLVPQKQQSTIDPACKTASDDQCQIIHKTGDEVRDQLSPREQSPTMSPNPFLSVENDFNTTNYTEDMQLSSVSPIVRFTNKRRKRLNVKVPSVLQVMEKDRDKERYEELLNCMSPL